MHTQQELRFDGKTYEPRYDCARLTGQLERVFVTMWGGEWWTLSDLARRVGAETQSISARIRDLKKMRFGNHTIEKRRKGNANNGLWEYRLIVNNLRRI